MSDTVQNPAEAIGADDWWRQAFGEFYGDLYAHRDDASARREVAGVLPRLREAGGPICDACCGGGRHLAALRAAGLRAVGFDFSAPLLRRLAERDDLAAVAARGDVRLPPIAGGLGAVTLFFTAFGYFPDDVNARALRDLAGLLRPGGWLMLDLPDPEVLRERLIPHTERMTASGLRVLEQRRLLDRHVEKVVTARAPDGRWHRHLERVRLYEPEEIATLATLAGLAPVERWPSLHGPAEGGDRHVHWLRRVAA